MLVTKQIDWMNRKETRKELKACGFVSQNKIVSVKGKGIVRKIRKNFEKRPDRLYVRLITSGAVTYWYPASVIRKRR